MATASGLKSLSLGHSDIHKIDPRNIHVKKGWNGRDYSDVVNQAYVEQLAGSIAKIGVKEPLTVSWENNKAWLTDGECRLRATMLAIDRGADIKSVPVKAEERYGNEADRLFYQVIRNSGKPFTPLEQAKVYKRLLDMGWQQGDIAEKSGVSNSHVSQVLSLLNMPEVVKQMVTSGKVSATLAQQTVNEHENNTEEAVQVLKDGIAIAKKQGKTRVTKRHLNGGSEDEHAIIDGIPIDEDEASAVIQADEKKRLKKLDAEKTLKVVIEAWEYAIVDDECSNEKGEPVVVATFPADQWELIRRVLKL